MSDSVNAAVGALAVVANGGKALDSYMESYVAVFAFIGSPGGQRFGVRWKVHTTYTAASEWVNEQARTVGGVWVGYVINGRTGVSANPAVSWRFGSQRVWSQVESRNSALPGWDQVREEIGEFADAHAGRKPDDSPAGIHIRDVFARAEGAVTALSLSGALVTDRPVHEDGSPTPPPGEDVWRIPEPPAMTSEIASVLEGKTLADALGTIGWDYPGASKARGNGVVVAVLDTGCDTAHPWFSVSQVRRVSVVPGEPTGADNNGHGTWCCGAVCGEEPGTGANRFGGVTPAAGVLSVQVLSRQGYGTDDWIAAGVDVARQAGVDVISMSLGGPARMPKTEDALRKAVEAGVIIVAAAGNDGPGSNTIGYPGAYDRVVTVGACTVAPDVTVAAFSSRGKGLDVIAPGVNLWGPAPGGRAARISGTSMATPIVAGALADLIELGMSKGYTRKEARALALSLLYAGASETMGKYGPETVAGLGLIDLTASAKRMTAPVSPPPNPPVGDEPVRVEVSDDLLDGVLGAANLLLKVSEHLSAGRSVVLVPDPDATVLALPAHAVVPDVWEGERFRTPLAPDQSAAQKYAHPKRAM